jgi:NitT/TauT family transport system substrate-binding protein
MNKDVDATTLTEPYITVAEKAGCRVILAAPSPGTEVATEDVEADTYRAFNKAVREAVKRINADKRKYLQYFLDYHKDDPDVAALTVDDLRPSRLIVTDPAPIPEDEARRSYEWMQSWGLLGDMSYEQLCDLERQAVAHTA